MTPGKDELFAVDLSHSELSGESRSYHVMAASFDDAERKAIKQMTLELRGNPGHPYVTCIELLGDVIL